ncbi:hypothetical protein BDQ12DRAFT_662973 [Crucibulum laeve]|uniref:dual-specificity kinase n=1 Tax=Crucibulum laeve TaxID=68775 RepID=A0A5C3MBW3_9AGAR|nr:hypothetical protein BDQ12DRAFT_662973 [Crucibulum laeve]
MSAPPSPHIAHTHLPATPHKKRDRPPALDIPGDDRKAVSDTEVRYERDHIPASALLPSVNISYSEEDHSPDQEHPVSRSASATSSLDPYYFGIQSPSESPVPPLPNQSTHLSTTPDQQQVNDPVTPARNPAAIDRRGLVGVGELATPRWTRTETAEVDTPDFDPDDRVYDVVLPEDGDEEDAPDSPWTIEAIDGESSEKEEVYAPRNVPAPPETSQEVEEPAELKPPRPLRSRPSIADESGGEEILYPRKLNGILQRPSKPVDGSEHFQHENSGISHDAEHPSDSPATSPPSAFSPPARRAKKRTSDEFVMDQSGTLLSKHIGSTPTAKDRSKDEKPAARRHRSLNASQSSTPPVRDVKTKERRRESIGLTINSGVKTKPERHTRQTSASSSSSNHADNHHTRRVHTSDFSNLPPSPSSSSIQQFLRNTSAPTTAQPPAPLNSGSKDNLHSSPNVAHSLLRGTQEGWSGMDDEATAEALRKLDGLTGKTARARASVGSFGRPSSSSRPGTPAGKSGSQWEGVSGSESIKSKRGSGNMRESLSGREKEHSQRQSIGLGIKSPEVHEASDFSGTAFSSDELPQGIVPQEKTPKKTGATARLSFTPKRGSTSSTTYASTPTTSSRDSASMSAGTSVTSVSVTSGRHSLTKARRNSASSDTSVHSSDASMLKDRVASLAVSGEMTDDAIVPPVPPLPKDLSSYRSPPPTSAGVTFPSTPAEEKEKWDSHDNIVDRSVSLEVPAYSSPPPNTASPARRQSQHYSSAKSSSDEKPLAVPKTPSKKWSFSSALNLKLSSSPSTSSSQKSGFPLSPRSVTFGQQLRKSTSKEQSMSSGTSKGPWSPNQPDAMGSAASLASLSSVGSVRTPALATTQSKTPDRGLASSRPGTASSASTNHASAALTAPQGPLSPTSSVRRGQSKRRTPSSIPFFRRSSSQSMQLPSSSVMPMSTSPTLSTGNLPQYSAKNSTSPRDYASMSTSVPGVTHKKSSVLSLGLPSLLKSSSRKSLHSDSKDSAKDTPKKETAKEERDRMKAEKKKEDKDRSESRISVLMSRKRGKTLSSTDPRKPKSPVNLPPMQVSALEPVTAQRVARLKSTAASDVAPQLTSRTPSASSRLTSQTASSMQKQSDTSLRSRNQLPTIAGSPSVGTNGTNSSLTLKDGKEPPSSLSNSITGLPKETPTKIPRISSRSSTVSSPPLKHSSSALGSRRTSMNVNGLAVSSSANPSPTGISTNEFGVIEGEDPSTSKSAVPPAKHSSIRGSPSTSGSRVPRQSSTTTTTSGSILHRKANRESVSFIGLRKSSTSSVASMAPAAPASETSHHRFSALSPSKGLKLLGPKNSAQSTRSSTAGTQYIHQAMNSPSSSRQSLSTPSPVPSTVDEEELLGDEEMLHYIRRQQAKKVAAGASQEELDELLKFPEPLPPGTPSSPTGILKSSQAQYLSEYERKEIHDYPSVYCIGARSKKKPAVPDNSTNNYGYDDERGDYLVVNHDHLAYRYEVVGSLGKGSFGQVLHCRDHCTGESVAVKIIRNKKRFHHQALVEIKILDNLRKWDSDGKHHVLKMTEHFYFRNHLCIATELLSINLYELIKANGFVGFTTALIRRFTNQMLMSLSLMRHHRIVHCDLKPENVLLRHPAKSAIKVIDFGSSCFEHEKISVYTYIQSRFYRSPEVILGMNYHMAIDMWSLGCILAELYTGFPIFPGENEQEQLSCIMEVLGIPDKEFVNRSSRKKLFFDPNGAPRAVVNSKGRRRRPGTKTLAQVLRCNDEEFVDFISKCLVWDPERRIKPQAAMRHPFVTAGRRLKPPASTAKSTPSSSSLGGSRTKAVNETPKKSLISAPTPLTARSSRTTFNGAPTTPSSSHASTLGSSSRSFRASQSQGLSTYSSSRTLGGLSVRALGNFDFEDHHSDELLSSQAPLNEHYY